MYICGQPGQYAIPKTIRPRSARMVRRRGRINQQCWLVLSCRRGTRIRPHVGQCDGWGREIGLRCRGSPATTRAKAGDNCCSVDERLVFIWTAPTTAGRDGRAGPSGGLDRGAAARTRTGVMGPGKTGGDIRWAAGRVPHRTWGTRLRESELYVSRQPDWQCTSMRCVVQHAETETPSARRIESGRPCCRNCDQGRGSPRCTTTMHMHALSPRWIKANRQLIPTGANGCTHSGRLAPGDGCHSTWFSCLASLAVDHRATPERALLDAGKLPGLCPPRLHTRRFWNTIRRPQPRRPTVC
ncbi:hypothetical protein LX32DRAFT_245169 [Colletotrichum zoysiae]|uniref:Uncharacterized protein n=1 Tax=Colletotrichum zoysiae TaxID=1216348 RepID=A0AAD9HMW9_9PEZI|nr:hypothetical protein LX32DRAFT_245169 [Colletotrichum zoysiae]